MMWLRSALHKDDFIWEAPVFSPSSVSSSSPSPTKYEYYYQRSDHFIFAINRFFPNSHFKLNFWQFKISLYGVANWAYSDTQRPLWSPAAFRTAALQFLLVAVWWQQKRQIHFNSVLQKHWIGNIDNLKKSTLICTDNNYINIRTLHIWNNVSYINGKWWSTCETTYAHLYGSQCNPLLHSAPTRYEHSEPLSLGDCPLMDCPAHCHLRWLKRCLWGAQIKKTHSRFWMFIKYTGNYHWCLPGTETKNLTASRCPWKQSWACAIEQ